MTIDYDHDRPERHGLAIGHILLSIKSFLHPLRVNRKVVFLQGKTAQYNRRTENGDCQALYNSDEHKPYTFQLSKTGGNVECGFFYTSTLLIQY